VILVSKNIRYVRIFAGVPQGGASNDGGGCRRRKFPAILMATPSETLR